MSDPLDDPHAGIPIGVTAAAVVVVAALLAGIFADEVVGTKYHCTISIIIALVGLGFLFVIHAYKYRDKPHWEEK